jgi:secondary thiamine-phosphate synthase enzyme
VEKLKVKTNNRVELLDITEKLGSIIEQSRVSDGLCVVFCPHTTAGLTINENADPSVQADILKTLNKLIPENAGYAHQEGNSDSHIKSSLFGSSLTVIVENNRLMLGSWQGIYFCESDGPRNREIWVKVI